MKGIKSGRIIFFLISLNLAVRLFFAFLPLEYTDGPLLPDDTYLSLEIAKNIAEGRGPLYTDSYTNGFQPLYVFLAAPLYLVFPDDLHAPVHASLVMLSIFDCLALFLALKLLFSKFPIKAALYIPGALWIFNPYIISNTLNGLETVISAFFIIYIFYYSQKIDFFKFRASAGESFCLGLMFGLAVFARIDNTILIFSFFVVFVYKVIKEKAGAYVLFKYFFAVGIGAIIGIAPWLIYSYTYTGDIYQVSGKAVRMQANPVLAEGAPFVDTYLKMTKSFLKAIFFNNAHMILIIAISVALLGVVYQKEGIRKAYSSIKFLNPLLIHSAIISFAYVYYIMAAYFFPRYLLPLGIYFLFIASILSVMIFKEAGAKVKKSIVVLSILILIPLSFIINKEIKALAEGEKDIGYMAAGKWSAEYFPDSTVIGSPQSGGVAYFAPNLKTYNLDGVVNKSCYLAIKEGRAIDYILEKDIEYVIGWEINVGYLFKHSDSSNHWRLQHIESIDSVQTYGHSWEVYKVIK